MTSECIHGVSELLTENVRLAEPNMVLSRNVKDEGTKMQKEDRHIVSSEIIQCNSEEFY